MWKLRIAIVAAVASVFMAPIAARATAVPVVTQFGFTGVCSDCIGVGIGTLTLQDYTLGTNLVAGNFVRFQYDSNLYHANFSVIDAIAGQLPTNLPGPAFVQMLWAGREFSSDTTVLDAVG